MEEASTTIQENAKLMMKEVNLPDVFWKEVIQTTIYTLNRV